MDGGIGQADAGSDEEKQLYRTYLGRVNNAGREEGQFFGSGPEFRDLFRGKLVIGIDPRNIELQFPPNGDVDGARVTFDEFAFGRGSWRDYLRPVANSPIYGEVRDVLAGGDVRSRQALTNCAAGRGPDDLLHAISFRWMMIRGSTVTTIMWRGSLTASEAAVTAPVDAIPWTMQDGWPARWRMAAGRCWLKCPSSRSAWRSMAMGQWCGSAPATIVLRSSINLASPMRGSRCGCFMSVGFAMPLAGASILAAAHWWTL